MSRLDSFIRRLAAQRDCLAEAARLIAGVAGPVVELGLGNGRTFDHLRELLPGREIFVFDRRVDAHPDCVPDSRHLIVGDFRETLPAAHSRIGARAALVHADIGTGDAAQTRRLAEFLGPALAPLLAPGAVVVGDQRLAVAGAVEVPLPPGVAPGRYFMWRIPA